MLLPAAAIWKVALGAGVLAHAGRCWWPQRIAGTSRWGKAGRARFANDGRDPATRCERPYGAVQSSPGDLVTALAAEGPLGHLGVWLVSKPALRTGPGTGPGIGPSLACSDGMSCGGLAHVGWTWAMDWKVIMQGGFVPNGQISGRPRPTGRSSARNCARGLVRTVQTRIP